MVNSLVAALYDPLTPAGNEPAVTEALLAPPPTVNTIGVIGRFTQDVTFEVAGLIVASGIIVNCAGEEYASEQV